MAVIATFITLFIIMVYWANYEYKDTIFLDNNSIIMKILPIRGICSIIMICIGIIIFSSILLVPLLIYKFFTLIF